MAKNIALNFTQNIGNGFANFQNADAASTLKMLVTAGADDEVVKAIHIISDDSVARVIDILINDGATDNYLTSVSVPANSGTNGTTAAIDAISSALNPGLPMDALGKRVLPLKGGYVLKARNQTQVTAAKKVSITALTEKF